MPSKMAGNNTSPPPDTGSSATRLQRNLAEKQRRDKLNGFISELATIVPMVSMASKRLDKTSILRLSAAHLRICQSPLYNKKKSKSSFKWRPSFFSSEQMREILESVEGFLLVTTTNGKIMYVSHSVEKSLGHQNIEMIGHSVFSFIHPSDVEVVRTQLQRMWLSINHKNGSSSSTARCSFYCRMRERSQPRSEVLTYQFVHVIGHMAAASPDDQNFESEEKSKASSSSSSSCSSSSSSSSSNYIFKAFIRVVHSNPYNELSLTDAIEDEYVTRHSPDGTIIFADHRLATITGHLPHEVFGMSAYEYIIHDDIPIAVFAHKLMFSSDGGTGLIVYRLRTRNDGFVYLKSTGYLQFEKSSVRIDHFMCVNKHLSEEEGEQELRKFIDRFTPHINGNTPSSLLESLRAVHTNKLAQSSLMPPKTITKNGALMDSSSSIYTVASPNNDNLSETELSDQSVGNCEKVRPLSSSRGISDAENKQVPLVWTTKLAYGKNMSEKLSLESEKTGQMFANHSPLTESSLGASSPLSEDTCLLSPSNMENMAMQSHSSPESVESLSSPLNKRESEEIMDYDELTQNVSSPFSCAIGMSPNSLSKMCEPDEVFLPSVSSDITQNVESVCSNIWNKPVESADITDHSVENISSPDIHSSREQSHQDYKSSRC